MSFKTKKTSFLFISFFIMFIAGFLVSLITPKILNAGLLIQHEKTAAGVKNDYSRLISDVYYLNECKPGKPRKIKILPGSQKGLYTVSYTHLDVYKRQYLHTPAILKYE